MIESIEKYGGFYVGRYELTGTNGSPTQKAGTVLSLGWYDSYNECQRFTKRAVQSTMIWGCQWDTMMVWLEKSGYRVDNENDEGKSTGWGNYSGVEIKDSDGNIINQNSNGTIISLQTGITTYTRANNIYDLAGNYIEWTQEKGSNCNGRVTRGGGSNYGDKDRLYASYRLEVPPIANPSATSRSSLYIK